MGRDIAVQNAATSHFHHHEDVQHSEASRDGYQEVSGHDGLGVVADKRSPVLRGCSPTASRITLLGPVRRTVRGETKIPSFTDSFAAIRSSP